MSKRPIGLPTIFGLKVALKHAAEFRWNFLMW